MNKKCLGCGIPLQDKDINLGGYISNIDKNAFITVGEVHEVMGEGFKGIDED